MRKKLLHILGALMLAAAALGAAACGDDDGTPSGSPTPTVDENLRQELESMVLTSDLLLPGLEQVSASVSTTQDVADASADPAAELQKLLAWGRQLGYDVQFEPGPSAPANIEVKGVQNTVSIYSAEQGAGESLADGLETARGVDYPKVYPEVQQLQVDEVPRPVGDEGAWFRISGFEKTGRLLIDDQVAFRVGRVRAFLRVVTVTEPGVTLDRALYLDRVEQWARTLTEQIRQVLSGGVAAPAGPVS